MHYSSCSLSVGALNGSLTEKWVGWLVNSWVSLSIIEGWIQMSVIKIKCHHLIMRLCIFFFFFLHWHLVAIYFRAVTMHHKVHTCCAGGNRANTCTSLQSRGERPVRPWPSVRTIFVVTQPIFNLLVFLSQSSTSSLRNATQQKWSYTCRLEVIINFFFFFF